MRYIPPFHSISLVRGLFQLTLTSNTGAAFSLFSSSTLALAFVAIVAVSAILFYFVRNRATISVSMATALALAFGGASGNLLDRLVRHYVIDFFDAYVGSHHWPVFNVADTCICTGVGIMTLVLLFGKTATPVSEPSSPISE